MQPDNVRGSDKDVNAQRLTRRHLQGFGLSAYQAKIVSKTCVVRGKIGLCNLYDPFDILQSARDYVCKPRIKNTTKIALESFITQLIQSMNNLVTVPFGSRCNEVSAAVTALISSKGATNRFKLRALALKGKLKDV